MTTESEMDFSYLLLFSASW